MFTLTRTLGALSLAALSCSAACMPASMRASPDKLPALEPKVLGSTPTTEALARLAKIKEKGKKNLLFSLTFNEAPPKELMPSWTSLDHAFSRLAGSGITYLPMDYFNTSRDPVAVPSRDATVMTNGSLEMWFRNLQTGGPAYVADWPFAKKLIEDTDNADKTHAAYYRLRMALALDRDVQTRNRGLILRALAKVGAENIEPQFDFSDDKDVGRLTVNLGYVLENGTMGPHNVVVTADVTRLSAEDRFGLIISSNGGQYYDKATVSHGLTEAVNEVVGHAVFVLVSRVMGIPYEQVLDSVKAGDDTSRAPVMGRTEPGNTGSSALFRVLNNQTHRFSSGERLTVREIHGNSVVVEMISPAPGALPTRKRLYVGDFVRVHDAAADEVVWAELRAIRFGTTAEFLEGVMAPSDARAG